MDDLSGLRVLVAGAGALGLCSALALRRAGAAVTLADPARLGDNASGVAAGMLAPAMEAALDPVSAGHFPLLKRARDAWPAFVDGVPHAALERCGALWAAPNDDDADVMLERLGLIGAEAERIGPAAAQGLSPGLVLRKDAILTPDDWRLDAGALLSALTTALVVRGGDVVRDRLRAGADGPCLSDGGAWDVVVVACGWPGADLIAMAPELVALRPIKGQIAALTGGPTAGPIVRSPASYVVPNAAGGLAGATMETGREDHIVEPETIVGLVGAARRLFPSIDAEIVTGLAAVRAATLDGLPLVGRSVRDRVIVAGGARRNGWLMAPMVAEAVVGAVAGRDPEPLFDPARFGGEEPRN